MALFARAQGWALAALLAMISDAVSAQRSPRALVERSPEEILREYTFVGDFSLKEDTRVNSEEVFWRYPLRLPRIDFHPDFLDPTDQDLLAQVYPATPGTGRPIQHLNRGRSLFLEGDYESARKTWLGGRARYGETYPFHRRNDYFIASSFLMMARHHREERQLPISDENVRYYLVNANTFLSWAFGNKKNLADEVVDERSPWAYYNQASIYYSYEKWPAAYASANRGLNFLRSTGRTDYRSEFRRMLAELMILNHSYLEAIQELDLALRQDPDQKLGAKVFARAGDIYFGLNNFELAEDMYALANRMDQSRKVITPAQFILRGEALFWLGRFSESQRMMDYGLRSIVASKADGRKPSQDLQALASMRIADSWLALNENEKAKLAYFRHQREFRSHITATYAQIRQACLELPYYDGNNIRHARKLLEELKDQTDILPRPAQELSWSCELASYSQHERTPEMVERVRAFAHRYPNSRFLQSLVPAVREVQARQIDQYFSRGDLHSAIDFFEKTRAVLFPEISDQLQLQLFQAYVDIHQSEKAKEFYRQVNLDTLSDVGLLRRAAMLAEIVDSGGGGPWLGYRNALIRHLNQHKWQTDPSPSVRLYVDRVLAADRSHQQLGWIYGLAEHWVSKEFAVACTLLYPVLQDLLSSTSASSREAFRIKGREFINKHIADLIRFETHCAYSMLETEQGLYESESAELAAIYLARSEVAINSHTAPLYFSLAEQNFDQGHSTMARNLWSHIVEHGSEALPETRYARIRLDPPRTELDKLWQD